MGVPDWRDSSAYDYTRALLAAEWAWEFLRRNPAYQADYAAFITTWRALEADYGAPPERDFQSWKADPRAYLVVGEDGGADGCRVDQDKVLIECALGEKWGFYQFPRDPDLPATAFDEPQPWREVSRPLQVVTDADLSYLGSDPAHVALGFDLDLPLGEQLERARLYLGSLYARRRREGRVQPRTVAGLNRSWCRYLRMLDAERAGIVADEAADAIVEDGAVRTADDWIEARRLRDGGYRNILLLPEGR